MKFYQAETTIRGSTHIFSPHMYVHTCLGVKCIYFAHFYKMYIHINRESSLKCTKLLLSLYHSITKQYVKLSTPKKYKTCIFSSTPRQDTTFIIVLAVFGISEVYQMNKCKGSILLPLKYIK